MVDYGGADVAARAAPVIALAGMAVALGAVSQAVTGFGFSLVSAPFLIAAYGAPAGVQLNLVLSVGINLALLVDGRSRVAWRSAGLLLAPAALASLVIGVVVRGSSSGTLTAAAGLLCLAGVGAVASGRRSRHLEGPTGTVVVGTTSGALNVVAGIGGPPIVLFGVNADWPPEVARPTMQAYFFGLNLVGLGVLGLPDGVPLAVVAALAGGLIVGRVLSRRLDARHVRGAVLVVAAVGSVLAVARGLMDL